MLTVVIDKSLMKITMHLILRGEATYKSYRAVITHILTEPALGFINFCSDLYYFLSYIHFGLVCCIFF